MNERFQTRDHSAEDARLLSTRASAADSTYPSHPANARWEKFAQDDPYKYILTSLKGNNGKEFWESGERTVRTELLPLIKLHDVRPTLCLEIGCGVGRLAIPLSRYFEDVVGADIAPSMLRQATALAAQKCATNISFKVVSHPDHLLQELTAYVARCDFIYSLLVFQHIPEFSAIQAYLHTIRALLHPQGLAYLQFDTRPQTWTYHLKTALPDSLLPRFWKRGIRRIRRAPEEIDEAIRHAGLEIVGDLNPHSAYHRYLLHRAQPALDTK
jgi:SAM-dependent methyltransferase